MRAVLDTNVLVSATFWSGDSARFIKAAEAGRVTIVLSEAILREFSGVLEYDDLRRKIRDKDLEFRLTVEKIASIAEIVDPTIKLHVIKDDPDDNKILECAEAGDADLIVTQDRHLLKLRQFRKARIVTPKEALELLL